MEGRYPNGLLLAVTNCTDPSKEEEFNAWYNHIHVPDVTAPGIFRHALRFVNTDPSAQAGKYVATYETTWEDVSKALTGEAASKARADWEKRGRLSDTIEVVASLTARRLWPMD
jgi:hypothetical protein